MLQRDLLKPTILISRFSSGVVLGIASNPLIREQYRTIATGQGSAEDFDCCYPFMSAFIQDRPSEIFPQRVEELYESLIIGWNVKILIIAQRLFWYAEVVANVCRRHGVDVFYGEAFFNLMTFDRIGAQYTLNNEIRRNIDDHVSLPYKLHEKTRHVQPDLISTADLYKKYAIDSGSICVFGQVPHDNSLTEHRGTGYYSWLHKLFTTNPTVMFAFKHHPFSHTFGVERYKNVTIIDENIEACFEAFDMFAAFSSTTILEGVLRSKRFITGGYHFLSGSNLTVETSEPTDVVEKLKNIILNQTTVDHWMSFLYNAYALDVTKPQIFDRLTSKSDSYFSKLT